MDFTNNIAHAPCGLCGVCVCIVCVQSAVYWFVPLSKQSALSLFVWLILLKGRGVWRQKGRRVVYVARADC